MFSIFCCVYEAIVKKKKALLYNYIDNNQSNSETCNFYYANSMAPCI